MAGYLYKKSNRMLNTQSTMFRRRWFVLHDHMLYWYKNSIEVTAHCHHTSPLSPQRPLTSHVLTALPPWHYICHNVATLPLTQRTSPPF